MYGPDCMSLGPHHWSIGGPGAGTVSRGQRPPCRSPPHPWRPLRRAPRGGGGGSGPSGTSLNLGRPQAHGPRSRTPKPRATDHRQRGSPRPRNTLRSVAFHLHYVRGLEKGSGAWDGAGSEAPIHRTIEFGTRGRPPCRWQRTAQRTGTAADREEVRRRRRGMAMVQPRRPMMESAPRCDGMGGEGGGSGQSIPSLIHWDMRKLLAMNGWIGPTGGLAMRSGQKKLKKNCLPKEFYDWWGRKRGQVIL